MIGYKALNEDFTTFNGFKYEIGKTYELPKDEKLEICKSGFHFCKFPIDVFGYYSYRDDHIIVEVEALGEIVQQGTKYATDKIKINKVYTREELNKLIINKLNTGNHNTGRWNTGSYNSGDYNTGSYNSGDYNTGSYNSGDYNNGNCNTGIYNTGSYNSGNCNSGDYNVGDCNTGSYNSGDYNSGYFNTNEPKMRMFNKTCEMTITEFQNSIDYNFVDLCFRMHEDDLFPEDRARIEALPNYDPKIFTEITGINFDDDKDDNNKDVILSNLNAKIESLSKEIDALNEIITKLKTKSN